MEFRQLGKSGLKVPVLSFGTGTFGGGTSFSRHGDRAMSPKLRDWSISAWTRALICLIPRTFIPNGLSETILGKAIEGRRDKVLISTKATFKMGHRGRTIWAPRGFI